MVVACRGWHENCSHAYIRTYIRIRIQGNIHASKLAWFLLEVGAGTIFAVVTRAMTLACIMHACFFLFFFLPPTISGGEVKKKNKKKEWRSPAADRLGDNFS
jgi:hypothetical protein